MRQGELQRVLRDFSPICICLQHIGTQTVPIRHYQIASSSPSGGGKLGTAIYIHNSATYEILEAPVSPYQPTVIKLFLPDNNMITICNIYNQPNFSSDFTDLTQLVSNLPRPLLLVGDFNAHSPLWDDTRDADIAGRNIENFITNNEYCCLNENDTYSYFSNTHGTFSSVDVSLCTADIVDKFKWSISDDNYSSDHYPVILTYLGQSSVSHIPRYNLHKADWDKYLIYTRNIPPFPYHQDHNETCSFLTDFIINAADKSIPKVNGGLNKSPVPWWSPTLTHLVKIKHTLSRNLQRLTKRARTLSKLPVTTDTLQKLAIINISISCIKPLFNKYNAKFRKAVIEGKILSWKSYVSSISDNTSIRDIWHKIRKISGSNVHPPRSSLRIDGISYHNPKDISNILGKHLADVSAYSNLDAHFKSIRNRAQRNTLNFETLENLEYNYAFTMIELENALSACNSSAPGHDNVSFEMIQKLAPLAKSYLLQFYNSLWLKNLFPKNWQHAIVIPIGKPGKDHRNPGNYRPISLTSCLCKVMEKMVNVRLTHTLHSNSILTPTQSGSIAGRSTLDPLTCLEDSIRRGFERKQLTVAVFFDIQKAYDTTWRYVILKKLHTSGLRGNLPLFIQNFLSDRTFQTRVDSSYSNTFKLEEGIPQGSVLSCTLFALAINDITMHLPAGVKNSLYFDDFAIYYTTKTLRHAQRVINKAISNVCLWADSVGFKFSVEKTKAITFYRDKRWLKGQSLDLLLYNSPIESCTQVKFLGIIFDQHLNWKEHLDYIKAKALKALDLLKKLSHTKWGARRDTMFMIYKATVLSILDYCCPIYASASESALKTLDVVHHQGIRLCTGAFRSSPVVSLLAESGMLPLSLRRNLITLQRGLSLHASSSPANECFTLCDSFAQSGNTPSFPVRATRLMNSHNILPVIPARVPISPPWTLKRVNICTTLSYLLKRNLTHPEVFRQHALEHIRRKGHSYKIYTDGSKSDNGVGAAAVSPDSVIKIALPSHASVFTAELSALNAALDSIRNSAESDIVIFCDSRSALDAIAQFAPRNRLLQNIQLKLHELITSGYKIEICWIPAHVGIQGNEKADQAAKEACMLDVSINQIPVRDWISSVKTLVFQDWQSKWEAQPLSNKLRNIKPTVYYWPTSSQCFRHIEVILTRLRIGHTKLTHGHLMSTPHGAILECSNCNVPMTVKHLLVDCPTFNLLHKIHFNNRDLTAILAEGADFNINRIISFLKATKYFNDI